jgi:hypothetical protein
MNNQIKGLTAAQPDGGEVTDVPRGQSGHAHFLRDRDDRRTGCTNFGSDRI